MAPGEAKEVADEETQPPTVTVAEPVQLTREKDTFELTTELSQGLRQRKVEDSYLNEEIVLN